MADYAGLHISRNSVRAVRAQFGGDGWKISDVFSLDWSDAETLVDALKKCAAKFGPDAKYVVGIPQTETSVRPVSFPFGGEGAIRAALPFEMETFLPYPAAEMETSYIRISSSKEETKTLALAARKERLAFYRTALKEAGIQAESILPEASALLHLHRLVSAKEDKAENSSILLADANGAEILLCFADSAGFCDLHYADADKNEIPRFISAVGTEPSRIFVGGEGARALYSGKFESSASWKNGLEAIFGSNFKPENLMTPLGLLAAAESRSTDALFPADPGKRIGLPSAMRFAAICSVIFVVMAFGNMAYGYFAKQRYYGQLREQQIKIFNAALPGAKAVKPAVQLKQKLDALDKKMRLAGLAGPGRADLLWVLKRISETLPDGLQMEADEILYEDDVVTLSGKTDKFESITRIKELYSIVTPFKSCEVVDSKATADGKKVSFKLRMRI
jgi:type II secretory pathway component PulL